MPGGSDVERYEATLGLVLNDVSSLRSAFDAAFHLNDDVYTVAIDATVTSGSTRIRLPLATGSYHRKGDRPAQNNDVPWDPAETFAATQTTLADASAVFGKLRDILVLNRYRLTGLVLRSISATVDRLIPDLDARRAGWA